MSIMPNAETFKTYSLVETYFFLRGLAPNSSFFLLAPGSKKPVAGSNGSSGAVHDLSEADLDRLEMRGYGLGWIPGGFPLFALDVDIKNGATGASALCKVLGIFEDGMSERSCVCALVQHFDTLIIESTSGGLHIVLRHPFDGVRTISDFGGIEFRGNKKYLVAPNVTIEDAFEDDKQTAFAGSYRIIKASPVAMAPQSILDLLRDPEKAPERNPESDSQGEGFVSLDMVEKMLSYIDPGCDRNQWIAVLGGLANADARELVRLPDFTPDPSFNLEDVANKWSAGEYWKGGAPANYKGDGDVSGTLSTLDPFGKSSFATIVHMARAGGYKGEARIDSIMDRAELADAVTADNSAPGQAENSPVNPKWTLSRVSKSRKVTIDFLIADLIPAGMRGLFCGGEQSLKTTAAVKIGVDLAMKSVKHHGDPKQKGIEYPVLRHGAVVYAALEDAAGVRARAREAMFDRDPKCDPEAVPFYVLDGSFKITSDDDVDSLIAEIDTLLKATGDELAAVFIDTTVFALSSDLSEDKSETVTMAYDAANRVIRHFNSRCSVIFIHHTGKDATKGARGSSNWPASSEFRYLFKPVGERTALDNGRTISFPVSARAVNEKLKNEAVQQPINYQTRRVVFDAEKVDGNGKVTKVKGSALLLDVIPWQAAKEAAGTMSDAKIVRLMVDKYDDGELFSLQALAVMADGARLLTGDADKRVDTFRKRVKRLLDGARTEDGTIEATEFNKAVARFLIARESGKLRKDGGPIFDYSFRGQGGKLGVWKRHLEAEAERVRVMEAEFEGAEDDDFGD